MNDWAQVAAAAIAFAGLVLIVRAHFNRRAARDAALDAILPWFTEDRDHESLPSMTRRVLAKVDNLDSKVDAFGDRLSSHLVDEGQDMTEIRQALQAGDRRMASIEKSVATLPRRVPRFLYWKER